MTALSSSETPIESKRSALSFDNAIVRELACLYISYQAVPLRRTVGLKIVKGDFPTFERNYHMDTWKQRMKAFLYLVDVGPDEAPLQYLRGSHHGLWRLPTEARIARYYQTGSNGFAVANEERHFLGSFWPHEIAQLKHDFGFEEVLCTGPAGTLVVFDGRGLHRATALHHGDLRLILTSYWIHDGDHT